MIATLPTHIANGSWFLRLRSMGHAGSADVARLGSPDRDGAGGGFLRLLAPRADVSLLLTLGADLGRRRAPAPLKARSARTRRRESVSTNPGAVRFARGGGRGRCRHRCLHAQGAAPADQILCRRDGATVRHGWSAEDGV